MNIQKILRKTIEGAETVESLEISPNQVKRLPIDFFLKTKTKEKRVYRYKDLLLKKDVLFWLSAEIPQEEKSVQDQIKVLQEWCKNMKQYIDSKMEISSKRMEEIVNKVSEVASLQDQIVTELKNYIDNKIIILQNSKAKSLSRSHPGVATPEKPKKRISKEDTRSG